METPNSADAANAATKITVLSDGVVDQTILGQNLLIEQKIADISKDSFADIGLAIAIPLGITAVIVSCVVWGPGAAIAVAIGIILLGIVVYSLIEESWRTEAQQMIENEQKISEADGLLTELNAYNPIEKGTELEEALKQMEKIYTTCEALNQHLEKPIKLMVLKSPIEECQRLKDSLQLQKEPLTDDEMLKLDSIDHRNLTDEDQRLLKKAQLTRASDDDHVLAEYIENFNTTLNGIKDDFEGKFMKKTS